MKIQVKAARVPVEFEVEGGKTVKATADFSDSVLTEAGKMLGKCSEGITSAVEQAEERGYETEDDYKAVVESVRPLIELVIGEKSYKDLVKSLGGNPSDSATQITTVFTYFAEEVGDRLGTARRKKASDYISNAV